MRERALIVDDSIPTHELIRSQIIGESLELHSAYEGETGLAMADALRPSLILLDVDMPGIDGFEVC
jgi:CheY-like chemotaxis protein